MQNALALKKNNKNNWNKINLWKSNSITIMFFGFLAVSKHATIDRSLNNSLNACKATAAAHLPKLWEAIYEICVLYKYLAKTRSHAGSFTLWARCQLRCRCCYCWNKLNKYANELAPKKIKRKLRKRATFSLTWRGSVLGLNAGAAAQKYAGVTETRSTSNVKKMKCPNTHSKQLNTYAWLCIYTYTYACILTHMHNCKKCTTKQLKITKQRKKVHSPVWVRASIYVCVCFCWRVAMLEYVCVCACVSPPFADCSCHPRKNVPA